MQKKHQTRAYLGIHERQCSIICNNTTEHNHTVHQSISWRPPQSTQASISLRWDVQLKICHESSKSLNEHVHRHCDVQQVSWQAANSSWENSTRRTTSPDLKSLVSLMMMMIMMMMMDELTLTWRIVLRPQGHVTVKKVTNSRRVSWLY